MVWLLALRSSLFCREKGQHLYITAINRKAHALETGNYESAMANFSLMAVETFITGISLGTSESSLATKPWQRAATPCPDKIGAAMKSIEDYFGGQPSLIKNPAGDIVLMKDGNKVRSDVKNPNGYDPHFHAQNPPRGKWTDTGDMYCYYFNNKE